MKEPLIISVGRQLGSGGCEIARMLAEAFDAKFFDTELINLAAERSGFNPSLFQKQDESHGMLKSFFGSFTGRLGRTAPLYGNSISQESIFQIQSEAIVKATQDYERCVFVGRCADYILRSNPRMFSVFITADDDKRIATVAERRQCDPDIARRYIERKEAERADYYNYYTSKKWGASQSYDLCINSSLLGLDRTAEVIAQVIRERYNLPT